MFKLVTDKKKSLTGNKGKFKGWKKSFCKSLSGADEKNTLPKGVSIECNSVPTKIACIFFFRAVLLNLAVRVAPRFRFVGGDLFWHAVQFNREKKYLGNSPMFFVCIFLSIGMQN